jgi:hypothetical protein
VFSSLRELGESLRATGYIADSIRTGPDALLSILKSYGLRSLERVDNLETLKKIVVDLESTVEGKP